MFWIKRIYILDGKICNHSRIKTDIYNNGRIGAFSGYPKHTICFFGLSGGGGVEISHTLNTVYHGIIHTLKEVGQDPSQISGFLTSTTETAAFNIRDQPWAFQLKKNECTTNKQNTLYIFQLRKKFFEM